MKKKIIISTCAFGLLLFVALILFPGLIATKAVNKLGPKVLGVPMKVEDIGLSLISGNGTLEGVVIANPEGFKNENAFELTLAHLDIKPSSVMSDTIVINEVIIDGAQVSYEGLKGNNLKLIQANAEAFTGASNDESETSSDNESSKESGKKFFIRKFVMRNTVVKPVVSGLKANITIPKIEIHNIGSEENGASLGDMVEEVISGISKSIGRVIGDLGSKVGEGVKSVGKSIGDASKDAVEGIKNLFK